MWIQPQRVQGLRRAVAIAVGEKHTIAMQGLWVPELPKTLDRWALAAELKRTAPRADAADDGGSDADSSSDGDGEGRSLSGLVAMASSPPGARFALTPFFSLTAVHAHVWLCANL